MSLNSIKSLPLNPKSRIDVGLATEAGRVLYVLNHLIARAKVLGLLEIFTNNDGELIKDIVDSSTLAFVLQACEKYRLAPIERLSSLSDSSNASSRSSRSIKSEQKDVEADGFSSVSLSVSSRTSKAENKVKERHDRSLSKAISMLEDNPKFLKLAAKMQNDLSPQMKFFIKILKEYKNIMEQKLLESSDQYKARLKYLINTYQKNENVKKEMEKLEEELVVTKTDANVCLIGRNILIKRHQNKIEKIKKKSMDLIERRVNESEKAMVNDWKISMVEQEKLKQDYNQANEKYESLMKEHLAIEKTMRAKRTKIENQVLGWIQKFDQDIGEKQAEEEEIQALLDKELDEVKEIQKQLDDDEEDYDEYMQEKAEYEEEMLDRKLHEFILHRSARRIQRSFRLFKARTGGKKKKKGKKGKLKGGKEGKKEEKKEAKKEKDEKEEKKDKKKEKKEKKDKKDKDKKEVKEEGEKKEEKDEKEKKEEKEEGEKKEEKEEKDEKEKEEKKEEKEKKEKKGKKEKKAKQ